MINENYLYLDNASTSYPKPKAVFDAITAYGQNIGTNPHRGAYKLASQGQVVFEETKQLLADLLHLADPSLLHFTYNATHAMNIVFNSLVLPGSHGIITSYEHNCVIRPVHELSLSRNAAYSVLEVDQDGEFSEKQLLKIIHPNTKYIAINHASNVTGSVININKLIRCAKDNNLDVVLDISQTVGLLPIELDKWDVDYVIGTCHKSLYGPSGIGFLFVKKPYQLKKYMFGGSGHNSASPLHPANAADRFVAGTQNYLAVAGLNGALKWRLLQQMDYIFSHEMFLARKLAKGLQEINHVRVLSPLNKDKSLPIVSFSVDGIQSRVISQYLDERYGIASRCGLHCAPLIHQQMNTMKYGAVRMSLGYTTTEENIDYSLRAINEVIIDLIGENFEKVS